MKTTTLAIALLSTSLAFAAYADTKTAAPTDTPKQTTTEPAKTAKPASTAESEKSGSVYDSVKSGWNSFIDVLAGPPTKQ